MTPIAEMVRKLFEKGVGQEAILIAIEAAEQALMSVDKRDCHVTERDESVTKRREVDRLRKQRWRDRHVTSRDNRDVSRDVTIASLSKQEQKEEREESKGLSKRDVTRGHRLPDDWQPSPEDQVTAEALVGPLRAAGELEKFRDHWKQQPGSRGVKLDWDAAWRNWIRRAAEYRGAKNEQTGSKIIQAADDLRRKIASFDGPGSSDVELRGGSSPTAPRLLSNR